MKCPNCGEEIYGKKCFNCGNEVAVNTDYMKKNEIMVSKRTFIIVVAVLVILIVAFIKSCSKTESKTPTDASTPVAVAPELENELIENKNDTVAAEKKIEETKVEEAKSTKEDLKKAFVELDDNITVEALKEYCDAHLLYYAEYEESYSFGTIYYKISYDKDCALNEYGGGKNDHIEIVFDSEENGRVVNYIYYSRGDVDRGRTGAYRYISGYLNVNHKPIDPYFVTAPRTNGYYVYSDAESAIRGLYE